MTQHSTLASDGDWSLIWYNPLPPRVKHFMWLVRKECLLTNTERVRQSISNDASCSRCGASQESTLRVL